MPDFTQYTRRHAADAKRPPALPIGPYPGIIKSFEFDINRNNNNPYVRYHLTALDWPDFIPESEKDGVDLSKRRLRRDFYMHDAALYFLHEFLVSMGADLPDPNSDPDAEVDYEPAINEMVGRRVVIEVGQYLNERTNQIENQVNNIRPDAS